MSNFYLIMDFLKEWIRTKSDDVTAMCGSLTGFAVGSTTDISVASRTVPCFFDNTHVISFVWTLLAMVAGAILSFWAKKLCECMWNKFKKKK